MDKIQARIDAIRKRVEEYYKHESDPYTFYPEEIDAVREIKAHAVEDIEFLLAQLNQKPR